MWRTTEASNVASSKTHRTTNCNKKIVMLTRDHSKNTFTWLKNSPYEINIHHIKILKGVAYINICTYNVYLIFYTQCLVGKESVILLSIRFSNLLYCEKNISMLCFDKSNRRSPRSFLRSSFCAPHRDPWCRRWLSTQCVQSHGQEECSAPIARRSC